MTNKGKMIEAIYAVCLTKRATLVIFYLINRANQELTCFPSVGTIARECNMSTRTVQRALNDLEEAGFLERESRFHDRGGQKSSLYHLSIASEEKAKEMKEVSFEKIMYGTKNKKINNNSDENIKIIEVVEKNNKNMIGKVYQFFKKCFYKILSWGA